METLRIIEKTSESLANKHETHIMFAVDKKTESTIFNGMSERGLGPKLYFQNKLKITVWKMESLK